MYTSYNKPMLRKGSCFALVRLHCFCCLLYVRATLKQVRKLVPRNLFGQTPRRTKTAVQRVR